MNWRVIKEPRGFIKLLQFILAIFAFATTTSVHTELKFEVNCFNQTLNTTNQKGDEIGVRIFYPYDLEDHMFDVPICNKTVTKTKVALLGGSRSSAEFYVFVGVIVFLYCIGATILYIFFDDLYRKNNTIIIADFVISIVFTLLWLISSSAWAQGLTDVKLYTDFNECNMWVHIPDCKEPTRNTCTQNLLPNFASLNVSIIFGFLNMVVWGGNLWFLWKETPWSKVQSKPPSTPGAPTDTDPQRI